MKQLIRPLRAVLLITLGVNLIFCPVIASFPLIKEKSGQLSGFPVSAPVASKKTDLKVKAKKNIDIKQGLISTFLTLNILSNCKNTQFNKPFQVQQDSCMHQRTLYPQNVDKSKIQTGLT